jgi:hypothetical protein
MPLHHELSPLLSLGSVLGSVLGNSQANSEGKAKVIAKREAFSGQTFT